MAAAGSTAGPAGGPLAEAPLAAEAALRTAGEPSTSRPEIGQAEPPSRPTGLHVGVAIGGGDPSSAESGTDSLDRPGGDAPAGGHGGGPLPKPVGRPLRGESSFLLPTFKPAAASAHNSVEVEEVKKEQVPTPSTFIGNYGSTTGVPYEELCRGLPARGILWMGLNNPIRKFFIMLAVNGYFNTIILLTIVANCGALAADSSEPDFETTSMGSALIYINDAFTAMFLGEMLVKVMAMGFIESPGSYIRDPWNMLDFAVVTLSWVDWLPGISTGSGATAARTVRVLRPLRTVTSVPGLRKLVTTLINSLPLLLDVCVLLGFVFTLYGIIGVELLSEKMSTACWQVTNWNASDPTFAGPAPVVPVWNNPGSYPWPGPFPTACSGPLIDYYPQRVDSTGLQCLPGWWCGAFVNNNYGYANFDNIGAAWLNVMYCMSNSGWSDVMYQAMDALSPSMWIYFVSLVVLTCWFAANLAVAVLYVQFAQKDEATVTEVVKLTTDIEDADRAIPKVGILGYLRYLVRHYIIAAGWFTSLTVACIIINTFFLAMIYYGMSDTYQAALELGNTILTAYFLTEMVLKLFALGPVVYAQDRMNLFDALVVIFALVELVLSALKINTANLNVLRCFRLLRVFKLARSWQELNRVMTTVLNSLNSIGYLSLLLLLFTFIMAVLGMQLFGYHEIFCDQYNLGASVQPVCPMGLSTEAGTCPGGHYYDCYAPCDPTQVGTWVAGIAGGFGWPGTPTGLCKAYGSDPAYVSVAYKTPVNATIGCNVAMDAVISANVSTGCGAAFAGAFAWYAPMAQTCNALDTTVAAAGGTSACGAAYAAYSGGVRNASLTIDGNRTVLYNGLPVVIASSAFKASPGFTIMYGPLGRNATCLTVDAATKSAATPCGRAYVAFNGSTTVQPRLTSDGIATVQLAGVGSITITSAIVAWQAFDITYPVRATPQPTDVFARTVTLCSTALPDAANPGTPCGRALLAYSNGVLNASLTVNGRDTVALYAQPITLLNATISAHGAYWIALATRTAGLAAYVDVALTSDGANTISFNGGPLRIVDTTPAADGSFRVAYADGSSKWVSVQTPQYTDSTEFWIWVGPSYLPRANFDDFYWAFLSIFQIISTENWNNVMWDSMRSTHWAAAFYHIFVLSIGFYIFLNLFLAILLDNFNTERPKADPATLMASFKLETKQFTGGALAKQVNLARIKSRGDKARLRKANESDDMSKMPELTGYSLLMLSPTNPLRVFLARLTSHTYFESAVLLVIVMSSITLALDSPRLDSTGSVKAVLTQLDNAFVVIYAVEMVLKIIALGLVLPPTSYLRNPWNVLDFVIAWIGIIGALLQVSGEHNLTALLVVKAIRTMRALRPLRMATRLAGLRVVVNSLFGAVPGILNVGMVILLFYGIFAIIGMNLFLGQYYNCTWSPSGPQPYGDVGLVGLEQGDGRVVPRVILDPAGNVTVDKAWCMQGEHTITWPEGVPPYQLYTTWVQTYLRSFDNFGVSLLAIFEASTTSLWLDVMWVGVDAVGVDEQPVRNLDRSRCIFFVLVIIVCCFFMLNLFVGVTIDKFVQLRELNDGESILLSQSQKNWVEIQTIMMTCQPVRQQTLPKNKARRFLVKMMTSEYFESLVMTVIMSTICVMAMRHANETPDWVNFQFVMQIIFCSIFTLEAILKIVAFTPHKYFVDVWNQFDFLVVLISIAGVAVDVYARIVGGRSLSILSLVRVLRVARIFRLIPKAKRLLKLFQTLFISLPGLANVGSVMLLFFFIFATVGMNLFGAIRRNYYLKRHANWEDFPNSMLLLFRMTGGENWNGLMHESMNMATCILITDPTLPIYGNWYNKVDPIWQNMTVDQWDDHCSPSTVVTMIYYLLVEVILTYVMVNLFIAVILDNFQRLDAGELPLNRSQFLLFVEVWSTFDPDATYWIPSSRLHFLIQKLEPPLGTAGLVWNRADIQTIVMSMDIPEHNGKVHFMETLHSLAGRVAGTQLPVLKEMEVHSKFGRVVPRIKPRGGVAEPPRYTAAHLHAALYVQAAVRGYLLRYTFRLQNRAFFFNLLRRQRDIVVESKRGGRAWNRIMQAKENMLAAAAAKGAASAASSRPSSPLVKPGHVDRPSKLQPLHPHELEGLPGREAAARDALPPANAIPPFRREDSASVPVSPTMVYQSLARDDTAELEVTVVGPVSLPSDSTNPEDATTPHGPGGGDDSYGFGVSSFRSLNDEADSLESRFLAGSPGDPAVLPVVVGVQRVAIGDNVGTRLEL